MGTLSIKPRVRSVAVRNTNAFSSVRAAVISLATASKGHSSRTEGHNITIPSTTVVYNTLMSQAGHPAAAPELDTIKMASLRDIMITNSLTTSPAAVKDAINGLLAAQTATDAEVASQKLKSMVALGNSEAHIVNFKVAATRAFRKIGFETVQDLSNAPGVGRLVGRGASGQTIVTEFSTSPTRGEALATELLGSCGSDSSKLLDQFEHALDEEGISGQPPTRQSTGGVARLITSNELQRGVSEEVAYSTDSFDDDEEDDSAQGGANYRSIARQ